MQLVEGREHWCAVLSGKGSDMMETKHGTQSGIARPKIPKTDLGPSENQSI